MNTINKSKESEWMMHEPYYEFGSSERELADGCAGRKEVPH